MLKAKDILDTVPDDTVWWDFGMAFHSSHGEIGWEQRKFEASLVSIKGAVTCMANRLSCKIYLQSFFKRPSSALVGAMAMTNLALL